MPNARKVYFATRKDPETRKRVFKILGDEFSSAENADDAEFIILDCDDPPRPRDWVGHRPNFVVPDSCYPPIILAALGGQGHERFLERLTEEYDGDVSALHLCETESDLLQTLKRLQAALPFYNARNAPAPDPAKIREMALSILKTVRE